MLGCCQVAMVTHSCYLTLTEMLVDTAMEWSASLWFPQNIKPGFTELPSGLTETLFSGNSGDIRSLSRGVHEIQSKICLSYSGNLEMQLRLLTFYYILDRNSVPSLDPECKNCQYYLLPCLHNHQQWLSWDI